MEAVRKETKELIDEMRSSLGQGVLKNDEKYRRKRMSMFEAFSNTVINNSKTYTKNVNLVRDVFFQNIRGKV